MRLSILRMAVPVLATAMLIGCEGNNPSINPGENPNNPNPTPTDSTVVVDTTMTADGQKQYLFDAAGELVGTFQAKDQQAAIELANGLYQKYQSYNWEQIGEDMENEFTKGKYEGLFGMPRRLAETAAGKRMPSVTDVEYLFSFAGDSKTFTFDEESKTVIISDGDGKSIRVLFKDFTGTQCELKIWGEGKTHEYSYTYEETEWVCDKSSTDDWGYSYCEYGHNETTGTKTIKVQLPEKIKMTLKQGNTTIISFTFGIEATKNDHLYVTYDTKVVNMAVAFDAKINKTNANVAFSYKYGSKSLLAATVNLPQYELISKDDNQDWEDWAEMYADRYEQLLGKVGAGEAKLDILGKIQIVAGVSSAADLYDSYKVWSNKYEKYNYDDYDHTVYYTDYYGNYTYQTYHAYWEHPYNTLPAQEDLIKNYEKYCKGVVYYGGDVEQARLKLQPYEYKGTLNLYDIYDSNRIVESISYSEYDIEPVFYFPKDETSYAFEDYFTSSKFSTLPKMAEDLVNAYIKLLDKDFGIEDIHFAD